MKDLMGILPIKKIVDFCKRHSIIAKLSLFGSALSDKLQEESDVMRFTRYRKELIAIIQKVIPHCKIYLFGSRARNTHRSGADIDIALDAGKPIPLDSILKIYEKIDQTTIPLEVDLVDIHTASDEMQESINLEKIEWAA